MSIVDRHEQRVILRDDCPLPAESCPDRKALAAFLVHTCDWPRQKVADLLSVDVRTIHRDLDDAARRPAPDPRLGPAEAHDMMTEMRRDPDFVGDLDAYEDALAELAVPRRRAGRAG